MFKFLLKLSFLVLFFNFCNAENISSIKISGNKRISNETVIVLGNLDFNKIPTDDEINESLKKLYETNFFKEIKVIKKENSIDIYLEENPIIEQINILGVKNKSILENLYKAIDLKVRKSFTQTQFAKDLDIITNILKTNGFYFADLKSSTVMNESLNSIILNIDIDLGKRAKIKEIIFLGDKKIKDKKLLEIITSEEDKFWKFISNKTLLNQSLINFDKRLLSNFYKNNGYYKVEILDSFVELDNDNNFKLIFNINAGEKFYFNDFFLEIPEDYNVQDFDKINKIFSNLKNKKYSLNNINLILNEIDSIVTINLYDFIDIKISEDIVDVNKLNYVFKIVDSEKFYVEKINIFGNFNTLEEVIRNKLIVDEGDPYNDLLFNKSVDEIRSTGFFKNVKTDIEEGSNKNLKIINLSVEEQPTGEISLAAGYGTSGTAIGGTIKEKNFLGKGINLDTNIEISEESIRGSLVYSRPNFNYSDNSLFFSLKSTSSDFLSDSGYKMTDIGFSLGTEFQQYENLFFKPEIDLSLEDLETTSTASSQLKKQAGTYSDIYFNYGIDIDLRNSSYNTSSGSRTYFFQEIPLISDGNELSNTLIFTKYKSFDENSEMVGKASFFFKNVNNLGSDDVRISKRAFLPYNRLRGFEKGKIGPVDNSDYIGGNYVSSLNLSTNLPKFLPSENFDLSYFVDLANVWGVDYSNVVDDSNSLRSSTGIALDLLTPIGPLSFSFTKAITKKSTDKTETFRFNLGTTF